MSGNPFEEPGDTERTVIRPMPGGRAKPAGAKAPPPRATAAPELADAPAIMVSPLAAAASPLLQLLARLATARQVMDGGQIREHAVREIRAFDVRAREAGIAAELLRPARYALCVSLDDVALNTPWGAESPWAAKPLLATFFEAAAGSDEFFDLLRRLQKTPEKFLPVIELMYLCLTLGYAGRYRDPDADPRALAKIITDTQAVIAAHRKPAGLELSPRWHGIAAPVRSARRRFPVWVAGAGALALSGGVFVLVSTRLNAASDALGAQVLAAPPSHMPQITRAAFVAPLPPPPPPAEPTFLDRLRTTLESQIGRGAVSVLGTATTPILRIPDHAIFGPSEATVQPAGVRLLQRIGAALRDSAGAVQVEAYTDDRPIRTVRFPSNFQLSTARARAVRAILARSLGDGQRVSAEGRADADPVAANATAAGREQNRRIEIVLRRQEQGP